MSKLVPPVKSGHLIAVSQEATAMRERSGSADVHIAAIVALKGKMPPRKIIHVLHRLFALNHLLMSGELKHWMREEKGEEFIYLEESLFKAAARAPLQEAEYVKDYAFAKDAFLPIVLEEVEAAGNA